MPTITIPEDCLPDTPNPADVLAEVCRKWDVTVEALASRKCTGRVNRARIAAIVTLRDLCKVSHGEIAALVGRDRTTVIYQLQAADARRAAGALARGRRQA